MKVQIFQGRGANKEEEKKGFVCEISKERVERLNGRKTDTNQYEQKKERMRKNGETWTTNGMSNTYRKR